MSFNDNRYRFMATMFVAIGLAIVIQIVRIQFIKGAEAIIGTTNAYAWRLDYLQPKRGLIYDRWGHLLAGNMTLYAVSVQMNLLGEGDKKDQNINKLAGLVREVLKVDYYQKLDEFNKAPNAPEEPTDLPLADYVPFDQAKRLFDLAGIMEDTDINGNKAKGKKSDSTDKTSQDGQSEEDTLENAKPLGLVFKPHLVRTYPEKALASNVIGFVSRDDKKGHWGVEEKFETLLAGTPKKVLIPRDPNLVEKMPTVPDGASLVLTIDREIQANVEASLDKALKDSGAASATILVMDPKTGEILAMATNPQVDLNEYWRFADVAPEDPTINRAVDQIYEPGSVFKIFTMATALDIGKVTPETVFTDTGSFEYAGATIHNWNGGAWGPQTMIGCMQHSLNVCLAWVGSQIGEETFYKYMQGFSFGHPTGIELAGEVAGILRLPGDEKWHPSNLATNSFGQGVSVTPVQFVMGASAIANDGKMVTPHIIRAIIQKGHQYEPPPQIAGTPISAKTAHTLAQMLTISLVEESSLALVPGYKVAGKTGTAEIPTPYGYTSGETNASFIGWGPSDDPIFMVFVWLEKPKSAIWGSIVAAPVFSEVAQKLFVLMNIPPDEVRLKMSKQ
ncbi:MAG: penicillin-binding protein 2 [Anaerolineales bacterium]|nr:penicillin-binding protein 2 [Anaerolineales bacterium]